MNENESKQEQNQAAPQSMGGLARAESLSPEERKEIARRAAAARWDADVPQATHEGDFKLADKTVDAAVLLNGKRLLTQATFLRALGRSRSPKAGTGVFSTVDGLPFFLQADVLKPFITEELAASTTPIFYKTKEGRRGVGYDAELLPQVADVYLKYRDACLAQKGGKIPERYVPIVMSCDILVRALARVGIAALIDEATGYQEVRDRRALQEILDRYLRKEFAAWASSFPTEFYRQIFRLRGWEWKGMKVNRPQCVANYTKDIVYTRLAPGILKELEAKNPMGVSGRRKTPHYWWLTEDIGHPALAQHLYGVIGLMRTYDDKAWDDFKRGLDKAYPRKDKNFPLFKNLAEDEE